MERPILFMMCGLQGSGKSTYANKLSEEYNATVFSSDALRIEMFGDVNEQNKNPELFNELHKRIKECLKSGKNAVFDATNINSKRRRSFLREIEKIDCEKRCVIMATPYDQCIMNNDARERKVPEDIIAKTYRHWNTPYWFEGWDDIQIAYWEECEMDKSVTGWMFDHSQYNQHNPHHSLTLGKHCLSVGLLLENTLLRYAGFAHDIGKPIVMSFTDYKGNETDIAHYYNHENVGAYECLFYNYIEVDKLDVSILVNLHMTPYYWEKDGGNEKLHKKYKDIWGEELYNNVAKLHDADKEAH